MLIVHGVLLLYVCLVTHILTLESMDFFVLLSVALITIIHPQKKRFDCRVFTSIKTFSSSIYFTKKPTPALFGPVCVAKTKLAGMIRSGN